MAAAGLTAETMNELANELATMDTDERDELMGDTSSKINHKNRRGLIAHYYQHVLDMPPKEEHAGLDGTVSIICRTPAAAWHEVARAGSEF